MIVNSKRLKIASKAATVHFCLSLLVAAAAAMLVFGLWYPYPYRELSGGKELFFLVTAVDVVCGPLLTFVLFNPLKSKSELVRDLGLVSLIQVLALIYGLHTVWQVRPLFLVQEIDRFKVVNVVSLDPIALAALPQLLKPALFAGPLVVAIREPKNQAEREKVMFESLDGGRDYAERADFYLPYEGENAQKSLKRARLLSMFLQRYPDQLAAATRIANEHNTPVSELFYLPVMARQDWVAILNKEGQIQGFLKGDGF